MRVSDEIIGQRFGSLTVLERLPVKGNKYSSYKCKCDCGSVGSTRGSRLRNGQITGCRKCSYQKRNHLKKAPDGKEAQKRFTAYRHSAAQRGILFDLTIYQIWDLIRAGCFYCGRSPSSGIDRYKNSEGYTPENSVSCCWPCNQLKGTRDGDDFLKHIHLIANNTLYKGG